MHRRAFVANRVRVYVLKGVVKLSPSFENPSHQTHITQPWTNRSRKPQYAILEMVAVEEVLNDCFEALFTQLRIPAVSYKLMLTVAPSTTTWPNKTGSMTYKCTLVIPKHSQPTLRPASHTCCVPQAEVNGRSVNHHVGTEVIEHSGHVILQKE